MIPPQFEYFAPRRLDEAIAILAERAPDAKVLSGGQSLIPLMKQRLAGPSYVVDINRIPDLDYLREEGGWLRIGALVRERHLEASDLIRQKYPILHDTSVVVADPLVRTRATVCGNVAHADPGNDHPATLLALGAEVVARGPKGERVIPITDFFRGLFTTALAPDEIVVELRVPAPPPRSGGAYLKLERKVGDYAIAAVAAYVELDENGVCRKAGIGLTNVGPMALKAREAEAVLVGTRLEEAALRDAARRAMEAAQPRSDHRGSADYKKDLVRVLTFRALQKALERARQNLG